MPLPTNPNRSNLDFNQIFQRCYDEVNDRLRTDAIVNTDIGDVEVQLSHLDDSIRLGDGTNFFTSETIGPKVALDVNIAGGSASVDASLLYGAEYKVLNISLALADTEYSFVLPTGTRQVKMRIRDGKGPLRIYESSGASNYYTVSRGSEHESKDINPSALSVYVQSAQAACILEVMYWEL